MVEIILIISWERVLDSAPAALDSGSALGRVPDLELDPPVQELAPVVSALAPERSPAEARAARRLLGHAALHRFFRVPPRGAPLCS